MKEIFNDILGISDVKGVIFIDKNNEIKIEGYSSGSPPNLNPLDLAAFMNTVGDNLETEIHFDNLSLYIRKIETGHLLVMTGFNAQMAMVRLNCDVLAPLIKAQFEKTSGIGRFFKKK
jgi:hypothetical protein